jgi:predicted nucleotidyltransferase
MTGESPYPAFEDRVEDVRGDPVIQEFLRRITPLRDRLQKIVLFGSRARGDEKPYSDYDILIVVEERERPLIDALYDAAQEVLYVTQRLISFKIYKRADFERFAAMPTPFMANVLREGIPLG